LLCSRKIALNKNNERRPEKRVVVCSAETVNPSMRIDTATIINSRRMNKLMILLGFIFTKKFSFPEYIQ
jgi:hypothetical protein